MILISLLSCPGTALRVYFLSAHGLFIGFFGFFHIVHSGLNRSSDDSVAIGNKKTLFLV